MRRPRIARAIAAAVAAAGLAAAACRTLPPDPDGRPNGATPLSLGAAQNDALDCAQGDCADWYLVEVPARGALVLDLGADAATAPDVELEMILYDSKGNALASERSGGRSSLALRKEAVPATYYVAVGSQSAGYVVPYTLTARNEIPQPPKVVKPPPTKPAPVKPPPKPSYETKRGSVLEISDEGRSVLLDIGKSQGIRVGLKGRLLRAGAAAGSLEIVEVYPEGSLASVKSGKADANSTAEIDVPLGAAAP